MGKVSSFLKNKLGTGKSTLTFKEKLTLALPGPASVIGPIIIHNTLMKFYTDIIGLDAKFYGWIYLIYSIWNAINDPLLGAYIDKLPFSKKRGKYVYLMKVTAPTMLISIFFMLLSSPSWNDWLVFWVLLAELFIFDTAYTVYSVAYNSYFLLAAPDKEARVDVDIIRTYIGNFLGAITTIIPTLLLVGGGNRALVIPVFSVVILVNAAMYFVALRTLKDKAELYETAKPPEHENIKEVLKDVKRIVTSKPFLTYLLFYIIARGAIGFYFTPFLYFMDSVVKSSNTVATLADVIPGLIMLILLPFAGKKIKELGSKTVTLLAFIPAILGFLSLMFITKGWQAVISYTLIVFALNVIQTAGVVLNGELIDYDEMQTGTRKTGLYGGLFALLTTSLTSLQATIFSGILSRFGYDGTLAEQSARAVLGIRVGAGLVPLIMCVIGFIPMAFFPIGKKLEKEISDFNVAAREGNKDDKEN
ncbi:MAG: MFS transporter [Lachnospiraceae bacterium]|nr:MFS transporter [Lachnospiraceae bacterium]